MDIKELRTVDPEEEGYIPIYFLNGPYAGSEFYAYIEQGQEILALEISDSIDPEDVVFKLYSIDRVNNEHQYVLVK